MVESEFCMQIVCSQALLSHAACLEEFVLQHQATKHKKETLIGITCKNTGVFESY